MTGTKRIIVHVDADKFLMNSLDTLIEKWHGETDSENRLQYVFDMYSTIENTRIEDKAKYHYYVQRRMYE